MGELERRQSLASLVPTRRQRQAQRGLERIHLDAQRAATEIDAAAAVAGRAMERITDVDGYRRTLAGGDEALNAVLTRIELGLIARAEQIQRGLGSRFDA